MWRIIKHKITGNIKELIMLLMALCHSATPKKIRILLLLAIGYLIMPFDILPDSIPGMGLLDDFIVVPSLMLAADKLLPPTVQRDLQVKMAKLHKILPWLIAGVILLFILWISLCIYFFYKLCTM